MTHIPLKRKENPTFYKTVIQSPQWKEWEKVANSRGFDVAESVECGWLSPPHFQAFILFCQNDIRYMCFPMGAI